MSDLADHPYRETHHNLRKIYIEPTCRCNLACRTCMRNEWDEPLGDMAWPVFERILDAVRRCAPRPVVFFGGYGEPFCHARILEMIAAMKQAGAWVEAITNGTLLSEKTIEALVEIGLDWLWVSIDDPHQESFQGARSDGGGNPVLGSLDQLRSLRMRLSSPGPELGISFVATRQTIAKLPAIYEVGRRLGVKTVHVSHLLPHTPEMAEDILYPWYYNNQGERSGQTRPLVSLPYWEMDCRGIPMYARMDLAGPGWDRPRQVPARQCPFLAKGSISVRWDGAVSPCIPLLHTHPTYLEDRRRVNMAYAFGRLPEEDLLALWASPEAVGLRERLIDFSFSPCVECNSCEMATHNREDCFGNLHPTCGGCLWARGLIQCP
ncbi:MAG TPA: radical SAM protein [Anaerolineaceae bacterium]|nr:radical SAM protein [Anaerolineaceae bacterium]